MTCQRALVSGDNDFQVGWQAFAHFIDHAVNGVRGLDEVLTRAFDDIERYYILPIEPRIALPIPDGILDGRDVLEVDGIAALGAANDDGCDILCGVELTF